MYFALHGFSLYSIWKVIFLDLLLLYIQDFIYMCIYLLTHLKFADKKRDISKYTFNNYRMNRMRMRRRKSPKPKRLLVLHVKRNLGKPLKNANLYKYSKGRWSSIHIYYFFCLLSKKIIISFSKFLSLGKEICTICLNEFYYI